VQINLMSFEELKFILVFFSIYHHYCIFLWFLNTQLHTFIGCCWGVLSVVIVMYYYQK
jgi:hypothetical protein